MSDRNACTTGSGSLLHADGHGEVWVDSGPGSKFKQYGWRCTTKEDSYSNRTLIGNWNQDRYDLSILKERKPMPSQEPGILFTRSGRILEQYKRISVIAIDFHLQMGSRMCPQIFSTLDGSAKFAHYYETSYTVEYTKNNTSTEKQVFKKEPHVFPGHQPELDSTPGKSLMRSCYTSDYIRPW